ncbi:MAG TPA: hypothetical protein VFF68_12490, partial [Anaerolineaceae bacterium]|nr:hypothetical protein [Anaerolineaceae bacterium]
MIPSNDTISRMPPPPGRKDEVRDRLATQITLITTVVSAVVSLAFLLASFALPIWQLLTLSAVYAVSWTVSGLATGSVISRDPAKRILFSASGLMLAVALTAALVEGLGIPLAAIVLIYALMVSAGLTSRQSDLGITAGMLAALLTAFLNGSSFFPRVTFPALQVFVPLALGVMLMTYFVLVSMGLISVNLRVKFITGGLAVAIVPLVVLSLIESQFIQTALQNQTNQALSLAAEQTATRLDEFIGSNLIAIEREA